MIGLAVGDAIGSQVEFSQPGSFAPVTDMLGGGRFKLAPGYWTDDTSMALCLAESLLERKQFDPVDQMNRYVRWLRQGSNSSIGRPFGIGKTILGALTAYMRTGNALDGSRKPRSAGNGSLMRLAPVPLYFHETPERAVFLSGESSRTTHALPVCIDACRYLAALICGTLYGASREELLKKTFDMKEQFWKKVPLCPEIADVAEGSFLRREPPEIRGNGYVVHTLEAALWAFSKAEDFSSGLLLAVNLGEDADTTAAVYGQLAGAFWGVNNIPRKWRELLHENQRIDRLGGMLASQRCEGK